jgi:biopolymer transport protein ExbB/TolQ
LVTGIQEQLVVNGVIAIGIFLWLILFLIYYSTQVIKKEANSFKKNFIVFIVGIIVTPALTYFFMFKALY